MKELQIGAKHTAFMTVEAKDTAEMMKSGTLQVLATPAVAALMEQAACELVQPFLEEGITTVGTEISLKHLKGSPVGADIRAEATLTEVDGRRYRFIIEAYDNQGLIATAEHTRFSVKTASFLSGVLLRKSTPDTPENVHF